MKFSCKQLYLAIFITGVMLCILYFLSWILARQALALEIHRQGNRQWLLAENRERVTNVFLVLNPSVYRQLSSRAT